MLQHPPALLFLVDTLSDIDDDDNNVVDDDDGAVNDVSTGAGTGTGNVGVDAGGRFVVRLLIVAGCRKYFFLGVLPRCSVRLQTDVSGWCRLHFCPFPQTPKRTKTARTAIHTLFFCQRNHHSANHHVGY